MALALLALTGGQPSAAQTPQTELRQQLTELRNTLQEGAQLLRSGNAQAGAAAVGSARTLLAALQGRQDLTASYKRALVPMANQLEAMVQYLETNQVPIPTAPPAAAMRPPQAGNPGMTAPDGEVSFSRHVAPLLVGRCGNCHVNRARGEFSASTFQALMNGAGGQPVVVPGSSAESRLVDVVRSGEMPPSGNPLTDAEADLLAAWIDAGAEFDGGNPQTPLPQLAATAMNSPANNAPGRGQPQVSRAQPNDTVSFAMDIAPVLLANCYDCHVQQTAGGLSVMNIERLLAGGGRGPTVTAGNPERSLLLHKLLGSGDGSRMPQRREPLTPDQIRLFATWVSEGANYDGGAADQPLEEVVRSAAARRMPPAQLTQQREQALARYFQLALPNVPVNQARLPGVNLYGTAETAQLEKLGAAIQAEAEALRDLLKRPQDEPLIRGGLSVLVFERRYDYAEWARMVEGRDLAREQNSHWRTRGLDAYVAMVQPTAESEALQLEMATSVAGVYVDGLAPLPDWFRQGAPRALAAKLHPRNEVVPQWQTASLELLRGNLSPEELLNPQLPAEQKADIGFALVAFLMSAPPRFEQLMQGLQEGQPWEEVLQATYGGNDQQIIELWRSRHGGGRRR